MNLLLLILAELRGNGFGQGAGALSRNENALVLFLLGLITGVVAMTAFFIYLARRETLEKQLPLETEDLLSQMNEVDWERIKAARPRLNHGEEKPRDDSGLPWERDPDWWRSEEK